MIPSLLLFTALDLRPPAPQSVPHMSPGILEVEWGAYGGWNNSSSAGTLSRPEGGSLLYYRGNDGRSYQETTARLTPLGLRVMAEMAQEEPPAIPWLMRNQSTVYPFFLMTYRRSGENVYIEWNDTTPPFAVDTIGWLALTLIEDMHACEDTDFIEILSGCD